jgi:hypothetical protein
LFQGDVNSCFEVVGLSLELGMAELLHFEHYWARSHVDKLVRCVFVRHGVAIWCAFLNENLETVDAVDEFVCMTYVAHARYCLALAAALVTLLLELLHKPRCDLLLGKNYSLTVALAASFDIFGPITPAASTVWTDDLAIVLDVE